MHETLLALWIGKRAKSLDNHVEREGAFQIAVGRHARHHALHEDLADVGLLTGLFSLGAERAGKAASS